MKYRRISTIWLKIFSVPLFATLTSVATYVALLKTIGVPDSIVTMTEEYPVKKNTLAGEFQCSSWCYRVPFDDGGSYMKCGWNKNGKEMFYGRDPNGVNYSTETIKEYFSDQGMDEPLGNLDLYWKGKNLYYGYYPGVSLIRITVAGIIDTQIYAGIATILLLCIYPIIMCIAFTFKARVYLLSPKGRQ